MRIGFVVHFFDFRNDVRRVVDLVSQHHEVVLFVRMQDKESIEKHVDKTKVSIRVVDERIDNFRNQVLDNIFRFFGRLPKSKQNYYLMEVFKISLNNNDSNKKRAYQLLDIGMQLPKTVSYDWYLSNLKFKGETVIDDIEQFYCFTDISESYFLARLLKENKKVTVYVYSWDHPCKHVKYSKKVNYLAWSEGIAQDLIELQDISAERIKITGASQFGYVHQFLTLPKEQLKNVFSFKYIYFGCAIGMPQLADKEVEIIEFISKVLDEVGSELKLVVRPYPVLGNWSLYEKLKLLPNVVLDDQFRTKDLSVQDEQILEKFIKIHFAQAFIHLGTTLGLEACFTETPSAILDFPSFEEEGVKFSLKNFVHQYQNEKYLLIPGFPNVIHSKEELVAMIQRIEIDKAGYIHYNHTIRSKFKVESFKNFANALVSAHQPHQSIPLV